MQTRNPYEHQHRLLKAVRIVDVLEESQISLQDARQFDEKKQLAICAGIGAGRPSKETWDMVCELYGKRLSDPFQ